MVATGHVKSVPVWAKSKPSAVMMLASDMKTISQVPIRNQLKSHRIVELVFHGRVTGVVSPQHELRGKRGSA